MITLEIDLFSGKSNPYAELKLETFEKLYKKYPDFQKLITLKPGIERLGYRGIKISLSPDMADRFHLPTDFWIATGYAQDHNQSVTLAESLVNELIEDIDLKKVILDELFSIKDYVHEIEMNRNKKKDSKPDDTSSSSHWDDQIYNPDAWNKNKGILDNNNCYAYATNKATNSFPQPGRYHGYKLSNLSDCQQVKSYAQIDGLVSQNSNNVPSSQSPRYRVALVVAPNKDYHWYREVIDSSGSVFWAHKPGRTNVINTDNSGNIITNPETANRGIYTIWCGYMISSEPLVNVE